MARARCCFDIRRVMGAMVRTYQITMGRAYYKCALGFSSTSNVTGTHNPGNFVTNLQQNMSKMQLAMFVSRLPTRPLMECTLRSHCVQKLTTSHPKNGAYTELFAGVSPTITKDNGGWVSPFGKVEPACKDLLDPELGRKYWEWSEAILVMAKRSMEFVLGI